MKSTKTIGSKPAATKMPKGSAVRVSAAKAIAKPALKAGSAMKPGKKGC